MPRTVSCLLACLQLSPDLFRHFRFLSKGSNINQQLTMLSNDLLTIPAETDETILDLPAIKEKKWIEK